MDTIYCYQPQYKGGLPASHKAFWRTTVPDTKVLVVDGGSSLLAANFNQALVHALNLQLEYQESGGKAGADVTHFAMLHDDIVPADGWLTQLHQDLKESGADLVSAVVPIKDPLGLTSTAIDGPDPFAVLRRLTMTEVFDLPEVFSGSDCGYRDDQLLVNSGCWICDFTKPWRLTRWGDLSENLAAVARLSQYLVNSPRKESKEFDADLESVLNTISVLRQESWEYLVSHFTINDRVRQVTGPDGKARWVAEVAPEDWNFSRSLHRLGCKIRATRRVRLCHYGDIPYNNSEPWGTMRQDEALRHRHGGKVVGDPSSYKDRPLDDVEGWLTDNEGRALAELAKGKMVVELGCYCGKSTIWMAKTAKLVHAVDTFKGEACGIPRKDTYSTFWQNLVNHGVLGQVTVHQGLFKDVLKYLADTYDTRCLREKADMVFIDGAHDYESVKYDAIASLKILKSGGVIAFHDYGSKKDPGVKKAVDKLFLYPGSPWEVVKRADSLIALREGQEG